MEQLVTLVSEIHLVDTSPLVNVLKKENKKFLKDKPKEKEQFTMQSVTTNWQSLQTYRLQFLDKLKKLESFK
jgi:hypothetical protein